MEPLSLSSLTHFPTGVSCMYDVQLRRALRSNSDQPCTEISIYDSRGQLSLTKEERIIVKSDVSSTKDIIEEVAEKFNTDKANVVHNNLDARNEESGTAHIFVILPEERSRDTLILLIQCHNFDQRSMDDAYFCLRVDQKQRISDFKTTIKNELRWKSLELFVKDYHMGDDTVLRDFDLHDFDLVMASKSISRMVTFLYTPTEDIQTHFRMCISTSDSVKIVKNKLVCRFDQLESTANKGDDSLHITCGSDLLKDHQCFGLTNKYHRENMYQIHFAPRDAIVCILNFQTGKERYRNFGKATILVSPNCSSSDLRHEAAKHMHVDPKAVKIDTENNDNKQRIEESSDVSMTNGLSNRCALYAGIKKKKTLFVKHPVTKTTEKIANLYALEPVSTLRKLIAQKYGINELQIVIKHKGITLKDENLLYEYPIKNNVVLDLHIYERRMHIIANVRFKRTKLSLIIDDYEKTTIGDILTYCAIQLKYRSNYSRCLYVGQCIATNTTVKAAGLTIGSELIILHFEEEEQLQGKLQRFFLADTDGRVIIRYGSMAGGLLLRASKNVKLTTTDVEVEPSPEGIYQTANKLQPCNDKVPEPKAELTKNRNDMRLLKSRFLRKAKQVIERKYLIRDTIPDNSCLNHELEVDSTDMEMLPSTSIPTKHGEGSITPRTLECPDETLGPFIEPIISDGKGMDDYKAMTKELCVSNDESIDEDGANGWACSSLEQQPSTYLDSVVSDNDKIMPLGSWQQEDESNTKELVECDRGANGQIKSQEMECSNLCSSVKEDSKIFGVPTCDPEEHVCRNPHVFKAYYEESDASSDSGYRVEMEERNCMQVARRMMHGVERRRAETEPSEISSIALARRLTVERYQQPNRLCQFFCKSITVELLHHISSEVGTHWKKLARRLSIDENEIDELEHQRWTLYETIFQCMRRWKLRGGFEASKERLIQALRDIKMIGLAEACERFACSGYHTA